MLPLTYVLSHKRYGVIKLVTTLQSNCINSGPTLVYTPRSVQILTHPSIRGLGGRSTRQKDEADVYIRNTLETCSGSKGNQHDKQSR